MTRTTSVTGHANRALDMARMLIRQARLLKDAGLVAEARELARRAIAFNTLGHAAARPARVRIDRRR